MMTRRSFLRSMGLFSMGLAVPRVGRSEVSGDGRTARRPNIVFILADDMGWGDVRVLNPASHIPTIHLDRLARSGITFTDAHAGSAACTPTRYGLMTGRHGFRNAASQGRVVLGFARAILEPKRLTLPMLLKQQGYETACFGKWNLGMDMPTTDGKPPNHRWKPTNINWDGVIRNGPLEAGFDRFYGMPGSLDMSPFVWIDQNRFVAPAVETRKNWKGVEGLGTPGFRFEKALPEVARRTVDYIEQHQGKSVPFFLYMALPAPHAPLVPLSSYRGRTDIGPYGDYCVELDELVGQVLDALKRTGQAEDTLICFTSDNGFWRVLGVEAMEAKGHLPSGGFRGYKAEIHEGGHRVPFFVSWPKGIEAGRITDEPVSILDWMATVADLLGVDLPEQAAEDSLSLLPILENRPHSPIHPFMVHHSNNGSLAIRLGRWKFVDCPWDGNFDWQKRLPKGLQSKQLPPVQLYDMLEDPHETTNVYDRYPTVVKALQAILARCRREGLRALRGVDVSMVPQTR